MKRRPGNSERWRRAAARAVSLWETASRGASYNPLSPGVIQNPYKTYARLRRFNPVHRSMILGSWVLTRYEDVLAITKNHECFSNDPRWRKATASVLPPAPDDYSILLVDPPEHTRLRKVVARVFSRANLSSLSETIDQTASELVEQASRRGTFDWITDVAAPAAIRGMLAMAAIPRRDHDRWDNWSRARAGLLEMIATRQQRKAAHLAGGEIQRYFAELLRERMQSTGSDAVSMLAREAAAGNRISTVEACDMLMVLMVAGIETTTNLIGNGMLALLRHPGQMRLLREEPGRIRDAIDEMLRYDSPVQTDFRVAKSEVAIGRSTIKSGDGVILLTGSANRDESVFDNPDIFDITRKASRHLSFGHGVHHCIGAELARMEASAVFTRALREPGTIKLAGGEPSYRTSTVIRGLRALPLHVSRR